MVPSSMDTLTVIATKWSDKASVSWSNTVRQENPAIWIKPPVSLGEAGLLSNPPLGTVGTNVHLSYPSLSRSRAKHK